MRKLIYIFMSAILISCNTVKYDINSLHKRFDKRYIKLYTRLANLNPHIYKMFIILKKHPDIFDLYCQYQGSYLGSYTISNDTLFLHYEYRFGYGKNPMKKLSELDGLDLKLYPKKFIINNDSLKDITTYYDPFSPDTCNPKIWDEAWRDTFYLVQ